MSPESLDSTLLEMGCAPLSAEELSRYFEIDPAKAEKFSEFYCKLFYLYKMTRDSRYLSLSLVPESPKVRMKIDREFSQLVETIGNDTITEFHFLTRNEARGDAFVETVKRKISEKGEREVLTIKNKEERGFWSYSVIVLPDTPSIEVEFFNDIEAVETCPFSEDEVELAAVIENDYRGGERT